MAKRKTKKKRLKKNIFNCVILLILVFALSYLIFVSNILEPHIDEVTTSYISFNNSYGTDMLKLTNLQKQKDEKGKSVINKQSIELKLTGTKNSKYSIIVYPISNKIDNQYVKFHLISSEAAITNSLSEMPISKDGGIIVYTNKTGVEDTITLRMWISSEYKDKVNDNSYEIKIKEEA